ncbi:hypothetical protein [Streptomyces sp. NPDC057375]|uniref:hypothetical protein n=1 Tax=Streptomyces sp. NPDC057375 TaxID=3346109 RepID=UPI0036458140
MSDEGTHANSDDTPETEASTSPNSEAAKYRRKLREAESRVEALSDRVNTLIRRDIEQRVANRLAVPGDLFDLGKHHISDLLNEAGEVDEEKLSGAVDALVESRPGLAKPKGWGSVGGSSRSSVAPAAPTWSEALRA